MKDEEQRRGRGDDGGRGDDNPSGFGKREGEALDHREVEALDRREGVRRAAGVALLLLAAFASICGPGIVAPQNVAQARARHVSVSDMWIDVSLGEPLVEWYNQVARPTDIARIEHVALIRELDQITTGRKLVVFKSAADAAQAVPVLRDRMDIIGYNLEAGPGTPVDEQSDPVASVQAMRDLARANNMLLAVGPDRNFALTYGVAIAPYVDIFVIQVQRIQTEPEIVRAYVVPLAEALRQANPNIEISVQVRTEGDVVALVDLIDSMNQHLDGISILTSPETTDVARALVAELRARGPRPQGGGSPRPQGGGGTAAPVPVTIEPATQGTPEVAASAATPELGARTMPTESASRDGESETLPGASARGEGEALDPREGATLTPYPVPARAGPLGAGGVYLPWWIVAFGAVGWAGVLGVVLVVLIIGFHGKNRA